MYNLKSLLSTIKKSNPDIYSDLSGQSERINSAIKSILIWINADNKNPLMITGNSGSSKSFITRRLFEAIYGRDNIVYCLPPSSGRYDDTIQLEIDRKPKFRFILIDESHSLDFDIESIQPESNGVMIAERYIKKSQLVFISHRGLGEDSSQDARLEPIEFGQMDRDEVIQILTSKYNMQHDCAEWTAWHSPRNIHNALANAKFYGTEQQSTKNPCGLHGVDLSVLRFYRDSSRLGNNTITQCSNALCVNVSVVKSSERRLSGEGFLAVLKQSKRSVTELGLDLLYTIDDNNPEKETPQAKSANKASAKSAKSATKQPNKAQSKQAPKSPSKSPSKSKAQSKQAQAPKMTGKSKASEIAKEINSDKLKQPDLLDKVGE